MWQTIYNVESACSSGAMAVHCAYLKVATGVDEISIGVGTENASLHRESGSAPSPVVSGSTHLLPLAIGRLRLVGFTSFLSFPMVPNLFPLAYNFTHFLINRIWFDIMPMGWLEWGITFSCLPFRLNRPVFFF